MTISVTFNLSSAYTFNSIESELESPDCFFGPVIWSSPICKYFQFDWVRARQPRLPFPSSYLIFPMYQINPLPNDKILDWSRFETFSEDKINVTEKSNFNMGRIDNTVGKGENPGYQHFLLFPQCF